MAAEVRPPSNNGRLAERETEPLVPKGRGAAVPVEENDAAEDVPTTPVPVAAMVGKYPARATTTPCCAAVTASLAARTWGFWARLCWTACSNVREGPVICAEGCGPGGEGAPAWAPTSSRAAAGVAARTGRAKHPPRRQTAMAEAMQRGIMRRRTSVSGGSR